MPAAADVSDPPLRLRSILEGGIVGIAVSVVAPFIGGWCGYAALMLAWSCDRCLGPCSHTGPLAPYVDPAWLAGVTVVIIAPLVAASIGRSLGLPRGALRCVIVLLLASLAAAGTHQSPVLALEVKERSAAVAWFVAAAFAGAGLLNGVLAPREDPAP